MNLESQNHVEIASLTDEEEFLSIEGAAKALKIDVNTFLARAVQRKYYAFILVSGRIAKAPKGTQLPPSAEQSPIASWISNGKGLHTSIEVFYTEPEDSYFDQPAVDDAGNPHCVVSGWVLVPPPTFRSLVENRQASNLIEIGVISNKSAPHGITWLSSGERSWSNRDGCLKAIGFPYVKFEDIFFRAREICPQQKDSPKKGGSEDKEVHPRTKANYLRVIAALANMANLPEDAPGKAVAQALYEVIGDNEPRLQTINGMIGDGRKLLRGDL